jgi:hypothetical protein
LLTVKKSTIHTEVDYLMGRAPAQVSRSLARAASDVSATSARSNSADGKSADSKLTGRISTGGTSADTHDLQLGWQVGGQEGGAYVK